MVAMPAFKSKQSYAVSKADQANKKREERTVRRAHAAERKADLYLFDEVHLSSWKIQLSKLGLQLRDILGDGNCLFRALADQIDGKDDQHLVFRDEVCRYMVDHEDDFAPFLVDTEVSFDKYILDLKKAGTFAGNDALVAFARLHNVTIVIHHLNSPSFSIEGASSNAPSRGELHLTYHNGEHYSSVRRIGDNSSSPAHIRLKSRTSHSNSSWKIDHISKSANCEDRQLITQTLLDCDDDVEATIEYINSLRVGDHTDSSSNSSMGSCPQHSESTKASSSTTIDSGICTCDSQSLNSNSLTKKEKASPQQSKEQQPLRKPNKTERKREKKKKKAAERSAAFKADANHNTESLNLEVYEVTTEMALLSV